MSGKMVGSWTPHHNLRDCIGIAAYEWLKVLKGSVMCISPLVQLRGAEGVGLRFQGFRRYEGPGL